MDGQLEKNKRDDERRRGFSMTVAVSHRQLLYEELREKEGE